MSTALRWFAILLLRISEWLEAPEPGHASATDSSAQRRVFELRTRIHCGYY
jgi:hypothetical protein